MMQFTTHYAALKIEFGATRENITKAYLKEAQNETTRKAYEVLSDPEKRKTYDLQIQRELKIKLELDAPENSLSKIALKLYQALEEKRFEEALKLIQTHHISPLLMVKVPFTFKGPLFLAAVQSGNVELLRAFCKDEQPDFTSKGRVYPEVASKEEKSALFFALKSGNVDMVRYVCAQGFDVTNEPALIDTAIATKSFEVVQFLVEAKLPVEQKHLQQACQLGNEAMVKVLLNVLPNGIDEKAALNAVQSGNVALARLFLFKLKPEQLDEPAMQTLFKALGDLRSIELAELVFKEWQLLERLPKCLNEWKWIKPLLTYTALHNKAKTPSMQWLEYLFKTLNIAPAKQDLETLLKEKLAVRAAQDEAYFQLFLTNGEVQTLYQTILKKGIKGLSFNDSLKFYIVNSSLRKFSSYYSHVNVELTLHMRSLIKNEVFTNDMLKRLAQVDSRFRQEALLFFCNENVNDGEERIQILIEVGADVNDTETFPEHSPLLCASLASARTKCKQLIEAGADADFLDPRRQPIRNYLTAENRNLAALFSAVKSGNVEMARKLFSKDLEEPSLFALFKTLGTSQNREMAELMFKEWQLLERLPTCLNEWKWIEPLLSPAVLMQKQTPNTPALSFIRESDAHTETWLKYLFEDLKITPPKEELQNLLNIKYNVRTVKVEAYLQSHATEGEIKTLYQNLLEKDIEGLSYHESILLYVHNLQQIRNNVMHGLINIELILSIQKKETDEMLQQKARENARFRQQALIFYCNENTFNEPATKIKILIDSGADVNDTETIPNRSPLSFAIDACDQEVINLLIQAGADVDFPDSEGNPIRDRLPDS